MEARKVWNTHTNLPFVSGPGKNFAKSWPEVVAPNRDSSRRLTNLLSKNTHLRHVNTSLFKGGHKTRKSRCRH
jgi:hypothetical protein